MIRVETGPGWLTIRGHAGVSLRGADIVCAAVSILAETLARRLPEGTARLGQGEAAFRFPQDDPAAGFAVAGLELLARYYPKAVAVSQNG